MKILSSKRRLLTALALVLLMLFLLRPGASRLKSRIISSISAGVGRSVDIGSVHLRLLPRPGFELENLVVYDDPSFGAEPMLRASQVFADLRLRSLLGGRIEISRLDLTEPSFNLVHLEGGRWNLEALLERAAHTPMAPTGTAKTATQLFFPYIEGSSGRINFKSGPEKRPYALINADFSLWQESENTWGVRLRAQPFRTDFNLNDMGQLRVDGTWQRAETFRETPLKFNVEWARAQLGQVTKFFSGNDKGWRGDIQVEASLTGSPARLKVNSTVELDDFRRYDITSGNPLRLAGQCDGEYSIQTHEFHEVFCSAPVGDGLLTLTGDMGLPGSQNYAISLKAESVSANVVLMLIGRAKKNIPEDLTAEGVLRGAASFRQDVATESPLQFRGEGQIADFRLSSPSLKAELGPTTVPFILVDDAPGRHGRHMQKNRLGMAAPKGPHIEFGPLGLNASHGGTATARGWLNRSGYDVAVAGETEVNRVLHLARMAGIPAISSGGEGSAQLDLQIAGSWVGATDRLRVGFPAPQVTGTAKLRDVHVTFAGTSEPVEISSAEIHLAPDGAHVKRLNAKAAGSVWTGMMEVPRGCAGPDACPIRFALNADELALGRINAWVNGRPKSRPWYRVLDASARVPPLLSRVHASGEVTARHVVLHGVAATDFSADVNLNAGKLQVSGLGANLFGGQHKGKWQLDFSVTPSVCSGSGTLTDVSLANVADQMEDPWIAGTASGSYELKGPCSADFWQSAEGKMTADFRNGTLPHVLISDDVEPLQLTRLSGQAQLHSGKIEVTSATLHCPKGTFEISGTATLKREVDLKLARPPADVGRTGYEITGTLSEPQVSALSNPEQARLKPLPQK